MDETNENLRERVSRIEGGYEHLATKADLANVKSELKADVDKARTELANVKAELKADIAETNSKIDRLTAEMARLETRMFFRMAGLVVAAVTAAVGFSRLLS